MSEQAEAELSCGECGPRHPLRGLWPSGLLLRPDVCPPPVLAPGGARWMNVGRVPGSAATSAWPWWAPAPLSVPHIAGLTRRPGLRSGEGRCRWSVTLDVAHFAPSEISLAVKDGFLEIGGRHEERPDEYGLIARSFTRKYRLPAEVDATEIASEFSADGFLTVEAPVPEASVPAASIIPIKVEAAGEEEEEHRREEPPETDPDSRRAPEAPEAPEAPHAPEALEAPSAEDHGEEAPLEVHGDQAHSSSATALLQQQEEGMGEEEEEKEETHEGPAGESLPSASVDAKGTESPQDHREAPESQESLDVDGENQEAAEAAAAEENAELEGISPSQELEAPDVKQERTE